jgi:hypothetical protein
MSMRYKTMDMRIKTIADNLEYLSTLNSLEHDDYMRGVYDGLETCLAELEQRPSVVIGKLKKNRMRILIYKIKGWMYWLKYQVSSFFY